MKYYGYSINCGLKNMQIDADILDTAISNQEKEPIFRLYGWEPKCISIGKNQNADFLTNEIDYVRRLTGGRALLHDNEVTYSYVIKADEKESIIDSYKKISGFLIEFFKTLNIQLDYGENKKVSAHSNYCMLISTGADVCYKNKKLIGSAQYRKQGYILQHGSILFDYDKDLLEYLFGDKVVGITCMKEIMPNLSKKEFVNLFEQYIK